MDIKVQSQDELLKSIKSEMKLSANEMQALLAAAKKIEMRLNFNFMLINELLKREQNG